MECKFCNTQNPDQAVYCKNCGKRLDGTTQCPACGGQISADDTFCIFCGANVKKPAHALVADETAIASAAETADMPLASEKRTEYAQTAKKVLNYVANGTAILTAVLALIFVFFIGIGNTGIEYFFHDGYVRIKEELNYIKDYNENLSYYSNARSNYCAYSDYIPLACGTVILTLTIIIVLILTVITVIRSIRNIKGESERNCFITAIAALVIYAIGAGLILSIFNMSGISKYSTYNTTLNSPTIIGITLGTLFALIMVICKIIVSGRAFANRNEVINYSLWFVGIVLLIVIIGLVSAPIFKNKSEDGITRYSLSYVLSDFAYLCTYQKDYELVKNVKTVTALIPLTYILMCLVAVFAAGGLIKHLNNLLKGNEKSILPNYAATVFSAILLVIFSAVLVSQLKKAYTYLEVETVKYTYAVPIVIHVFSVLALIENIVYRAMKRPLNPAQNEY